MQGPEVDTSQPAGGISFDGEDYVGGIWMVGNTPMAFDWLASVWVNKQTDRFYGAYRFRYYAAKNPDNEAWSGLDEKRWQHLEGPAEDFERVVQTLHGLAALIATGSGGEVDYIPRGLAKDALDELIKRPWCHSKPMGTATDDPTVGGVA